MTVKTTRGLGRTVVAIALTCCNARILARYSGLTTTKTVSVVDRETLESLMLLTQRGDAAASARLYDQIAPNVLGLVVQIVHDRAQAEEVTQEVFVELWQHAAEFDPARGSAKSWILRRARLRAIDRVRSVLATLQRDDRDAFLVA